MKILVCDPHHFGHRSKTQHLTGIFYTGTEINSIPARLSTGSVRAGGNHELWSSGSRKEGTRQIARLCTPGKSTFGSLRDLLGEATWNTVLEKRMGQLFDFLFKNQAQDASLPMCRKGSYTDEQGIPDKTHLSKGKKR